MNNFKGFIKSFAYVIFMIIVQVAFSVPFLFIFNSTVASVIGTLLGSVFIAKVMLKNKKIKYDLNYINILQGFSLGVALFMVAILISIAFPVTNQSSDTTQLLTQQSGLTLLVTLLFATLGAPITEEVIFRGAMRNFFPKKSKWGYILITSLIFALLHIQSGPIIPNIVIFLTTGTIGAINAYVYWKTDDIILPIMSHIIYNSIVVLISIM